MKKLHFIFYPVLLILFSMLPVLSIHADDWGLRFNQTLGADGMAGESSDINIPYSGTVFVWLSAYFGQPENNTGKLYFSSGMTSEYADKNVFLVPELLRTELTLRIGSNNELKFGRIPYTDPLGFIVSGLFDGTQISLVLNNNTISAGIWYTGLLYKKNANITMTSDDLASYYKKLDYENFWDTYWAPRRILLAFDWSNPYLAPWLRLNASLIGQFDLSGSNNFCHSQYLAFKAGMPLGSFIFDLGGCFELAQTSDKLKISLAGELGIAWMLPTPVRDRLQLTCRLTNAAIPDDLFTAFIPITTISQGTVLQAKFSGLSMFSLDYTARLHEVFSINLAGAYFIASDYDTYRGYPKNPSGGRDGNLLGSEFSGRLVWSPFSDLQLNLGGGIFMPSLGNTGSKNGALWRANINMALSIF